MVFESCCLITAYAFKLNNARYCIQDKVNNHINSDLNVKLSFQIMHMTLKFVLIRTFRRDKMRKTPYCIFWDFRLIYNTFFWRVQTNSSFCNVQKMQHLIANIFINSYMLHFKIRKVYPPPPLARKRLFPWFSLKSRSERASRES